MNTYTSPKVQYGYTDGSANLVRPTGITYPNGRAVNVGYGTGGGMDDILFRVAAIIDSNGPATDLAD